MDLQIASKPTPRSLPLSIDEAQEAMPPGSIEAAIFPYLWFVDHQGVVKKGDGPLRSIDCNNVWYVPETRILRLNDIDIDFANSVVEWVNEDDGSASFHLRVDGTDIYIAVDFDHECSEPDWDLRAVQHAVARLKAGAASGIRVVVDGRARVFGANDIALSYETTDDSTYITGAKFGDHFSISYTSDETDFGSVTSS